MGKKPLSLKARAIALLAQREHSLSELRVKLLRLARTARALRQAQTAATADESDASDAFAEPGLPADLLGEGAAADSSADDPMAEVDDLLAWLQQQGYLSEQRFVESRIHARAGRFGNLRIRQELVRHGVELPAAQQAQLKHSELARAREVWQRRFGGAAAAAAGSSAPSDAVARAKQSRFLAGRGFSPEVIARLMRSLASGGDGVVAADDDDEGAQSVPDGAASG